MHASQRDNLEMLREKGGKEREMCLHPILLLHPVGWRYFAACLLFDACVCVCVCWLCAVYDYYGVVKHHA